MVVINQLNIGNRFKRKGPINWKRHNVWLEKNAVPTIAPKKIFVPRKPKKRTAPRKFKEPIVDDRFKRKGPINWAQHSAWLSVNAIAKSRPKPSIRKRRGRINWDTHTVWLQKHAKSKVSKIDKSTYVGRFKRKGPIDMNKHKKWLAKHARPKVLPTRVHRKWLVKNARHQVLPNAIVKNARHRVLPNALPKVKSLKKRRFTRFRRKGPINWNAFQKWAANRAAPKPELPQPKIRRSKLPMYKLKSGVKRLSVPKWITKPYESNEVDLLYAPITKVKRSAITFKTTDLLRKLAHPKSITTKWSATDSNVAISRHALNYEATPNINGLAHPKHITPKYKGDAETDLTSGIPVLNYEASENLSTLAKPRTVCLKFKERPIEDAGIPERVLNHIATEHNTELAKPKSPLPKNIKNEDNVYERPKEAASTVVSAQALQYVASERITELANAIHQLPKNENIENTKRYKRPDEKPTILVPESALNYAATERILKLAEPRDPLPKIVRKPKPERTDDILLDASKN